MNELRFIFKFKERVKRLQPAALTDNSSTTDSNELMQDPARSEELEVVTDNQTSRKRKQSK